MSAVKKLLKYPLVLIFMGFILVYSIVDSLYPEREYSDLENKQLASMPDFSWEELINNEYTPKFETYVNDQFVLRDSWINIKSRMEWLFTKVENNGIIYGEEDQLFAKFFSLDEEQFETNSSALSEFVKRHGEKVSVLIAPVASNILSDRLPFDPPMVDENLLIDQIYSAAEGANIIDVRTTLKEHDDEYIYYRNDHHWTTYGAYLAYLEYANQKGLEIFDIGENNSITVDGFLGTHFSKSKYFAAVPDTLTYYESDSTMTLDGIDLPIYDTAKLETADKYAAFLRGNFGFITVNGEGDGKVLVIKDSYANSFVPFLTASYGQIDVVDFRIFNASVSQLMEQQEYDDVLILYNSTTFQEDGNFAKILFN